MPDTYVVLGAGVTGLTTAHELTTRFPTAEIIIIAKHIPGDLSIEYASPYAGADWFSIARDNGRQENWDAETFHKFNDLATTAPECGVRHTTLHIVYDEPLEQTGLLTPATGKIWYEELVGGLRFLSEEERPEGTVFGFEMGTFQVDVPVYLGWLFARVLERGVSIRRHFVERIEDVWLQVEGVKAVFNCTGLGAYDLGGVEDRDMFPTRGQVLLVESPTPPLKKMYNRPCKVGEQYTTYIMPRGDYGGVTLGGCRLDGVWDGEMDPEVAEGIKQRCCALCPQLGKPGELKVINHGVGLRPSREGGPRVEKEEINGNLVVHSYGAGGAGYQASWGMAKDAVDSLSFVANH